MTEGPEHLALKKKVRRLLEKLGANPIVEEGNGNVDIAGNCRGVWIAFEVGDSSPSKIKKLRDLYHIVVHLPYCYTPNLTWPIDELEKKLDDHIIRRKVEGY